MKTAASVRDGFLLYYLCTFGAAQANPDRQDKTLQSNRHEKLENFYADDTDAEASAHARVPLFVFRQGLLKASHEIGERPFPFCGVAKWCTQPVRSTF